MLYGYSLRDNLTSAADQLDPTEDVGYGYDPVGNRGSETLTPPGGGAATDTYGYVLAANRLTQILGPSGASRSFGHDGAGNTTAETRVAGVTDSWAYTYDTNGRMVTAAANGTAEGQYLYNALGQQVSRTAFPGGASEVTLSVHDLNGNRIAEHDHTGAVLREYLWLDGRPLAIVEGGQTFWLHWDHIGRPVLATDATGAVVWAARYLPFGGLDAVAVDAGAIEQTLRFPGQWFQAETGLHQNWMRDYDPTTGRYLQADPLGLVDGASVYGYVRQSPVRWTDPSGENAIAVGAGAGGITLGPPGAVGGAIIGGLVTLGYLGYELYQYCTSTDDSRSVRCINNPEKSFTRHDPSRGNEVWTLCVYDCTDGKERSFWAPGYYQCPTLLPGFDG